MFYAPLCSLVCWKQAEDLVAGLHWPPVVSGPNPPPPQQHPGERFGWDCRIYQHMDW